MKKFVARLALALLPLALYLCFFIAFEPNNYFGFKNTDTMFTRIMGYTQEKPASIIIGDSRLANFDMALVDEAAGRSFYNLAFGGATLEESVDLLEYALAQNSALQEVVLGLSFYTVNESYGTVSRMATIEKQIANPFAYISNFQYNIDAAVALMNTVKGVPLGAELETAEHTEADYMQNGTKLPYRKDLIAYASLLYGNCAKAGAVPSALGSVDAMVSAMDAGTLSAAGLMGEMQAASLQMSKFAVNEKQLARLIDAAALCRARGVRLTVVLPPMHQSVQNLVCVPLGIDKAMQSVLAALHNAGVRVLDYEWENPPAYTDDAFFDGFHLDLRHGLPAFTKTLFSAV